MSYKRARADFEALERIAELDDQVELDSARLDLMRNPTKATARLLYESGIRLWFQEHGITPETSRIAERHNIKKLTP